MHMEVRGQLVQVDSLLPCGPGNGSAGLVATTVIPLVILPVHSTFVFLKQGLSLNQKLTNWVRLGLLSLFPVAGFLCVAQTLSQVCQCGLRYSSFAIVASVPVYQ